MYYIFNGPKQLLSNNEIQSWSRLYFPVACCNCSSSVLYRWQLCIIMLQQVSIYTSMHRRRNIFLLSINQYSRMQRLYWRKPLLSLVYCRKWCMLFTCCSCWNISMHHQKSSLKKCIEVCLECRSKPCHHERAIRTLFKL